MPSWASVLGRRTECKLNGNAGENGESKSGWWVREIEPRWWMTNLIPWWGRYYLDWRYVKLLNDGNTFLDRWVSGNLPPRNNPQFRELNQCLSPPPTTWGERLVSSPSYLGRWDKPPRSSPVRCFILSICIIYAIIQQWANKLLKAGASYIMSCINSLLVWNRYDWLTNRIIRPRTVCRTVWGSYRRQPRSFRRVWVSSPL